MIALPPEQMQELIELGIDTSTASMCWVLDKDDEPYLMVYQETDLGDIIPAFTLQDILEMLPKGWTLETYPECRFIFTILTNDCYMHEEKSNSPLEAAFKMLKWCKQNNYI